MWSSASHLSLVRSSLKRLLRDAFTGDVFLIGLAVVVAVASVVSVSAYSDRVQRAIASSGASLIAADLVVASELPLDPMWTEQAQHRGLAIASTIVMTSMVGNDSSTTMAEVKAVSPTYPLRGEVHIQSFDAPDDTAVSVGGPAPGSVWIDPELAAVLGINDTARLSVGAAEFSVDAIIVREPDRGTIGFSIAPRVMMAIQDLERTALMGPGALVDNNLLLAGDSPTVTDFKDWLDDRLGTGVEVRSPEQASPRMAAALERSERFLSLAALVSLLLAGAAIARLTVIYVEREANAIALLRALGARVGVVTRSYLWQLAVLGLVASLIGVVIGYLGQMAVSHYLANFFSMTLPAPGWRPVLLGCVLGLVTLLGFSAPALARMRRVSPLRLMTRRPGFERAHPVFEYGVTGVIAIGFIVWIARDWLLARWLIVGVLGALAAFGLVSLLVIWLLGRTRLHFARADVRHGISNITRRPRDAVTQTTALGIGVMALLLLTYVKDDLFNSWEARLPVATPNHFFVNVLPDQRLLLGSYMEEQGLNAPEFSPMVKARLLRINDQAVQASDYEEGFARRMVTRAANLSWTTKLGDDNLIVAGQWHEMTSTLAPLSVETDFAEALGLTVGDRIDWSIEGTELTTTVTSLREVDWESFRPNFFLVLPEGVLDGFTVSYVGSVYVPEGFLNFRKNLTGAFPNITDIDVSIMLQQVRELLDRLNQAMAFIFLFTIASGLLVLVACVIAVERQRRRDIAIIKTVGGRKRFIYNSLAVEFVVLGLISGGIGALMASITGYILATRVLDLAYTADPELWIVGLVGGAAIVTLAGFLATRSVTATPPWSVLR